MKRQENETVSMATLPVRKTKTAERRAECKQRVQMMTSSLTHANNSIVEHSTTECTTVPLSVNSDTQHHSTSCVSTHKPVRVDMHSVLTSDTASVIVEQLENQKKRYNFEN